MKRAPTKDLCIVGAALRVEHYEVAGYTVAISLAKALKQNEVASLLNENLQEELAAAKGSAGRRRSRSLKQAASEKDASENEDEKKPKTAKEKKS